MTDWKTLEDRIRDWATKRHVTLFLAAAFVVFVLTLWGL